MADDFGGKPVPIRLAQRYPNGSMMSYSARALSRHGDSLRVLVNEEFESGVGVSVWAPFWDGLTECRVTKVLRSRKQPGYFEVILQSSQVAGRGTAPGGDHGSAPGREVGHGAGAGNSEAKRQDKSGGDSAGQQASATALTPELEIALVAEHFAALLSKQPHSRFSETLSEMPAASQRIALQIAASAAIHQLDRQGLVSARGLLAKRNGRSGEKRA